MGTLSSTLHNIVYTEESYQDSLLTLECALFGDWKTVGCFYVFL